MEKGTEWNEGHTVLFVPSPEPPMEKENETDGKRANNDASRTDAHDDDHRSLVRHQVVHVIIVTDEME